MKFNVTATNMKAEDLLINKGPQIQLYDQLDLMSKNFGEGNPEVAEFYSELR